MKFPALKRRTIAPRKILKPRPSLFLFGGAGLFLLSLLVGIYLFFPNETLKHRIIQEVATRTRAELQIESARFLPVMTLDLSGLSISGAGLPVPLDIDELAFSPQWTSLVTGDPGVAMKVRCLSGEITAGFRHSGTVIAQAKGLQFDLPFQQPMPFQVAGILDEADIRTATRLDRETVTQVTLQVTSARLLGLDLGATETSGINLGEITLELTGEGRSMQVKSLVAKGGDFEISGNGILLIGRTAESSRIRLAFQIKPGQNADPSLTSLLELAGKPDPNGIYPLQLTGTIAKPLLKQGG
jgi:type II secretion system protein N